MKTSFDKFRRKRKKRAAYRFQDRDHFVIATYKKDSLEEIYYFAAKENNIDLNKRSELRKHFRNSFVNAVSISGYMYHTKWMAELVCVSKPMVTTAIKNHKQYLGEPEYVKFFNMFTRAIKIAVEKQAFAKANTAKETILRKENSEHLRTIAKLKQELSYAYELLNDMKERNSRLARHVHRANVLLEQNGYSLIPDNLIIQEQDGQQTAN